MAFKTLAQRFEETSGDIYTRFPPPSSIRNNPLLSTTAEKKKIYNDSRLFPVISAIRDKTRISLFLGTRDGLKFSAMQFLLQTGNTFADTRFWNPLSMFTFPFAYTRRHVAAFPLSFGAQQRNRGFLQQETIDRYRVPATTVKAVAGNILRGYLDKVIRTVISPIRAATIAQLGVDFNTLPRPEYRVYGNNTQNLNVSVPAAQSISHRGTKKSIVSGIEVDPKFGPLVWSLTTERYLRDVAKTNSGSVMVSSPYFSEFTPATSEKIQGLIRPATTGRTLLRDNMNKISPAWMREQLADLYINQITYGSIQGTTESDIIPFQFKLADGSITQFRALISEIKHNSTTEFSEQRYIGRNERFVTYAGAKRSVALTFNVVAFSKAEIDNMWLRINYLTGLTFPRSISASGFMTPPLFMVTIGRIFDAQPCYITSLDFEMLDGSIVFDIDAQVSQVIGVNMSLSLLEKRTKVFDSPLYKITEDLQGSAARPTGADITRAVSDTESPGRDGLPEVSKDMRVRSGNSSSSPQPYIIPQTTTTPWIRESVPQPGSVISQTQPIPMPWIRRSVP